jgi:hypothetical protein
VDQSLYFIPGKLWVAVWVDDFVILCDHRSRCCPEAGFQVCSFSAV